jgi:hypothetical protein
VLPLAIFVQSCFKFAPVGAAVHCLGVQDGSLPVSTPSLDEHAYFSETPEYPDAQDIVQVPPADTSPQSVVMLASMIGCPVHGPWCTHSHILEAALATTFLTE